MNWLVDFVVRRLSVGKLRGDRGAILAITSIVLGPLVITAAAISIDVANWYYAGRRAQTAADAAALAAAVYMPGSLSTATTIGRDAATRNGFTNGLLGNTVTLVATTKSAQIRATVATPVHNFFGELLGKPTETLTRTAVAEYRGPVPMGSPCNLFGNEPSNGIGGTSVSSGCTSTPQFWANIGGPGSPKSNGDQFATRSCSSGNSGCTSTTNTEYNAVGYFYKLTVRAAVSQVQVQIFDPSMVHVGDHCDINLPATWTLDKPNNYETVTGDAANRYKSGGTSAFCTGDQEFDSNAANAVTTFTVRSPISSDDALTAPLVTGCTQQFKGYGNTINFANVLDKTKAAYNDELSRTFRQWVTLCTINNPTVGTYYIQARSNLPYGTATFSALSSKTEYTSVNWSGHNRYALRAKVTGTASNVTVGGFGYMSMYANANAANATFHLARVGSASAGMSVDINLFDAGDAASAGTITILPPTDALNGASALALTNCLALGDVVGTSTTAASMGATCRFTNVSSAAGWNGKRQTVRVPIPVGYTCTDTDYTNGCWFKINFAFPAAVQDTTTWSTDLVGQPVRLVE